VRSPPDGKQLEPADPNKAVLVEPTNDKEFKKGEQIVQ
jgi:hypothetical protein